MTFKDFKDIFKRHKKYVQDIFKDTTQFSNKRMISFISNCAEE